MPSCLTNFISSFSAISQLNHQSQLVVSAFTGGLLVDFDKNRKCNLRFWKDVRFP